MDTHRFTLLCSDINGYLKTVGGYNTFNDAQAAFELLKKALPKNRIEIRGYATHGDVLSHYDGRAGVTYQIMFNQDQIDILVEGLELIVDATDEDKNEEVNMLIGMFKELKPEDRDVLHGFCL